MLKSWVMACAALMASSVQASVAKGDIGATIGAPIDSLYPEIAVDDDGWRGLLPVILYDIDELAEQSPTSPADKRSEREDQR